MFSWSFWFKTVFTFSCWISSYQIAIYILSVYRVLLNHLFRRWSLPFDWESHNVELGLTTRKIYRAIRISICSSPRIPLARTSVGKHWWPVYLSAIKVLCRYVFRNHRDSSISWNNVKRAEYGRLSHALSIYFGSFVVNIRLCFSGVYSIYGRYSNCLIL